MKCVCEHKDFKEYCLADDHICVCYDSASECRAKNHKCTCLKKHITCYNYGKYYNKYHTIRSHSCKSHQHRCICDYVSTIASQYTDGGKCRAHNMT